MTLPAPDDHRHRVDRLRALVRVLDEAVRIPGTPIRFGADALVGLIPGLGDVAGAAMSGLVVVAAARMGVGVAVLLRMVLNVGIDMLVGAVPLAGDLFDFGWRANTRNLALIERALEDPRGTRRSSAAIVAGVVLALLVVVAAGVALAVLVARAVVGWLNAVA